MCLAEQIQAYRQTSYWVEAPEEYVRIRLDRPTPDLDRYLQRQEAASWAFITAYNPGSEQLAPSENRRRLLQLQEELERRGLAFLPGVGVGDDGAWPPERSLLVVGMARETARRIGRDFGQNAVLFGLVGRTPELICCCEELPHADISPS